MVGVNGKAMAGETSVKQEEQMMEEDMVEEEEVLEEMMYTAVDDMSDFQQVI